MNAFKKITLQGNFPVPDFQHQKQQVSYIADTAQGKAIYISDSKGNLVHQVKLPSIL